MRTEKQAEPANSIPAIPREKIMCKPTLRIIGMVLAGLVALAGCAASGPPTKDLDSSVRSAENTLARIQAESGKTILRDHLKKAKAILIVTPGSARGVAMARAGGAKTWSGPAFYNVVTLDAAGGPIGGAGLSAGKQSLEMIVLAMSDKALDWFISPRLPGTGDLNVFMLTGTSAGKPPAEADMLVLGSKEGTRDVQKIGAPLIAIDKTANEAFYGRPVTPADIMVKQSVNNPQASPLQKAVSEAD